MQPIGKYRWTICALLFFATTVNYLDRQVLSLLKPTLEDEFGWTNTDYANIASVFQFTYAISMLFAGRFIDWLGTKWGFGWAIIIWSIGAILHAAAIPIGDSLGALLSWAGIGVFSISVMGFMFSRAVLGLGESGNFPAAIKATAEYFPKKERALATGIFNSGTNVGAIIAPMVVPLIAITLGWQMAFIITGAIGLIWLFFWQIMYDTPEKKLAKGQLKQSEYDHIMSDKEETVAADGSDFKKVSWLKLLQYKQTW